MNIDAALKAKKGLDIFLSNHPKFPDFIRAVGQKGIQDGTTVDICVTQPDGKSIRSHLTLCASDAEIFEGLKNLL